MTEENQISQDAESADREVSKTETNSSILESEQLANLPIEQQIQQVLEGIVEEFRDYFLDIAKSRFQSSISNISFKKTSVKREIGMTGLHLVSVDFETEKGPCQASLAVKIFPTVDDQENTAEKIRITQKIISTSPQHFDIYCPQIVFSRKAVMVMEGIEGHTFRDSTVLFHDKLRRAGRALASIHGSESNKADVSRYSVFAEKIPAALPLENARKIHLQKLLLENANETASSISEKAGAVAFGDFHKGNILYEVPGTSSLVRTHIIDPEFLDTSGEVDRLEDIVNFFLIEAIDEWRTSQQLLRTSEQIRSFLVGYNEFLAHSRHSLETFYATTIPIQFQMALGVLLATLNFLALPEAKKGDATKEIDTRVTLAEELLSTPGIVKLN